MWGEMTGLNAAVEVPIEAPQVARALDPSDSCPPQWAYVTSTELFNAVCCSRRAGKSTGAVLRAIYLMATQPGSRVHYVSLIRRNARKHFWGPLKAKLREMGWAFHAHEGDMIMTLPNGSWCQALSCPDIAAIKNVKGDWTSLFMVDECQEPNNDVLESLIDVAAMPMLTDRGGMLDLLGVPPEVEPSYFSKALDSEGWAHWRWTQFDHDFPAKRETKWQRVKKICEKRGLPLDVEEANDNGRLALVPGPGTHYLILREWFGIRAKDKTKFAYEYQAGRNDYDPEAVNFDDPQRPVRSSAGLDIASGQNPELGLASSGKTDSDAIVVDSWFPDDPNRVLYTRFAWKWNGLDVDDLALVVALVHKVYRPGQWVGDTGGHGAMKVLATLAGRLKMVFAPKPTDVLISARVMNDDYRTARLRHPTADKETARLLKAIDTMPWTDEQKARARELIQPMNPADLTDEVSRVKKAVNQRTLKVVINPKGPGHSDISEANRYAHHASRHWAAKAPPPPEPDMPEIRTSADRIQWQLRQWEQERRDEERYFNGE